MSGSDTKDGTSGGVVVPGMMAPIHQRHPDGTWDTLYHLQCLYRVICGDRPELVPEDIAVLIDPSIFPASVASIFRVEKDEMPDRSERILSIRVGSRSLKAGEVVRVGAATVLKMQHEIATFGDDEVALLRGRSSMQFTDQLATNVQLNLMVLMGAHGLPKQLSEDIVVLRNLVTEWRKKLRALQPDSTESTPSARVSQAYAQAAGTATPAPRTPPPAGGSSASTASSAALPVRRPRNLKLILLPVLLILLATSAVLSRLGTVPVEDKTLLVQEVLPVTFIQVVDQDSIQGRLNDDLWRSMSPPARLEAVRQAMALLGMTEANLVLLAEDGTIRVVAVAHPGGSEIHLSD